MKRLLLACLFPTLLNAQNMNLTEQLGKTVLYGDIAVSPDGNQAAWVQSTAATTSKQTYVCKTAADSTPIKVAIGNADSTRDDAAPAWSPDSKKVAFLSNGGEGEQKQLWTAGSDGSAAKKLTNLSGYVARPHWSHDGKQIALLYIEGAGGGGPLMAAPPTTGVIDKAIHNQRIAVIDATTGQVKQVSPPDLH